MSVFDAKKTVVVAIEHHLYMAFVFVLKHLVFLLEFSVGYKVCIGSGRGGLEVTERADKTVLPVLGYVGIRTCLRARRR